jgi:GH25 family lysozyme M1 (1,4-beta-N-acetylmuramidase)
LSLIGADISEYQGAISFGQVKASGKVSFLYLKASEGMTLYDAKYGEYHDGAKVNDLPTGAYHFFHFLTDPVAQANHFLAMIAGREGTLVPMVDVERASEPRVALSARDSIGRLGAFIDIVDSKLRGKKTLIYTGLSFWNDVLQGSDSFSGHPVWPAAYGDPPAPVPNGWSKSTMWQNTDSLSVPGILAPVDGDILLSGLLLDIMRSNGLT